MDYMKEAYDRMRDEGILIGHQDDEGRRTLIDALYNGEVNFFFHVLQLSTLILSTEAHYAVSRKRARDIETIPYAVFVQLRISHQNPPTHGSVVSTQY